MPVWAVSAKINAAVGASAREAGMPHWGLKIDVLERLQYAVARALDATFHPSDADRLLALGRALGMLARIGFDDPDFLTRVQTSRDALASRVGEVLGEAVGEAGDGPVDPELLLTLTEALAAAFDPHAGAGR